MHLEDTVEFFKRISVRIVNDHVVPAVRTIPSTLLMLPDNAFKVDTKDQSMYGKYMRDINIGGFSVLSDAVIRFRTTDNKPFTGDLLVAVGRYARFWDAQDAILKLVGRKDDKVHDLQSFEVDNKLTEDLIGSVFDIGTNENHTHTEPNESNLI